MFTKQLFYVSMILTFMFMISSCTDESLQDATQDEFEEAISSDESIEIITNLDEAIQKIDESNVVQQEEGEVATRSSTLYYYPSPNGGQCGATSYLFYLKDYGNDPQRAVRLKLPNGNRVFLNLQRWNDYQYTQVKIFNCGDVYWSMVNKITQQPLIGTYKLKNTGVDIRITGTSYIGWPYKNDGSSWQNKNGWHIVPGSVQHIGRDRYAQDWNWGSGDQDLGKPITAPLCGKVVSAGWLNQCLGKTVDIVHYVGDKKVMHRVAHMNSVNVSLGQWIERGSLIGTLGKDGSSTCTPGGWTAHTHCVLYELHQNEDIDDGIKFRYSYWYIYLS